MTRRKTRGAPALAGLALAVAMTTGCVDYEAPVQPPPGAIYGRVSAPLILPDREAAAIDLNECESKVRYVRVPFSFSSFVAGSSPLSVSWGMMDVQTALDSMGFEKIVYADYEILNVLGVYAEMKITAYGK